MLLALDLNFHSLLYLQIYNEMIRDLLNPSSGILELREDSKGEIQVAGITEVSTINAQEVGDTSPQLPYLRAPSFPWEEPLHEYAKVPG